MTVGAMTRGEALNNPGDIEHSAIVWNNMASDQPDKKLVKYKRPIDGLIALAKDVRANQREGINTLTAFAAKYAPRRDDNDPVEYAKFLADFCQWHPDQPVVFDSIIFPMVKGIITREQGRCIYPDIMLNAAIAVAQGKTVAIPEPKPVPAPEPAPKPSLLTRIIEHPSATKGGAAAVGAWAAALVIGGIQDWLPQIMLTDQKEEAITGLCIFIALHFFKDPS